MEKGELPHFERDAGSPSDDREGGTKWKRRRRRELFENEQDTATAARESIEGSPSLLDCRTGRWRFAAKEALIGEEEEEEGEKSPREGKR